MAGSRFDNPYVTESPCAEMPNQEESMSCSAACPRKLLLNASVDKPESEIRNAANFHPAFGIDPFDLAGALDLFHPNRKYLGGCVNPQANQTLDGLVLSLTSTGPWIANLHLPGMHSVIVIRIERDIIHLLDPWGMTGPGSGCGTSATIFMDEFLRRWQPNLHAVFEK